MVVRDLDTTRCNWLGLGRVAPGYAEQQDFQAAGASACRYGPPAMRHGAGAGVLDQAAANALSYVCRSAS
jgi:hypothetical protein